MSLTLTDLFCGGGGSSTGATQVPGVTIRIAANHWDLAVDVHQQNHPGSDHAAVDLHEENPAYFPRTDILWASPECTKWSQASGGKYAGVSTEGNDIAAAEAHVDDCLFRMLEPSEVAAGMAFPADYIWGGTRRERVKLCGNAVTPPAARDLIAAVAESLS